MMAPTPGRHHEDKDDARGVQCWSTPFGAGTAPQHPVKKSAEYCNEFIAAFIRA